MTDILFFTPRISPPVAEKLAGAYEAAQKLDWRIRPIELARSGRRAADFVRLWHPGGAIVECADENPVSEPKSLGRLPVVWLDRDPAAKGGLSVCLDVAVSSDFAADELLASNPPALAFVGWHEDVWWSRLREKRLKERAAKAKVRFFPAPTGYWRASAFAGEDAKLGKFLRSLPRGTGVFAVNDQTAERVIASAQQEKIDMPGDLLLVGADNDMFLCENSRPTISSVAPDFRKLGALSVKVLAERMKRGGFIETGHGRAASMMPPPRLTAPPKGLVRRESSRPVRAMDKSIVKALELIRREATNGLEVPSVVAAMGCSRRSAELRFKKELGHTILDEIREARFNHALELLSNPNQAIEPIANLCGWDSPVTLKRLFRERTGLTMREWRSPKPLAAGGQPSGTVPLAFRMP